MRACVVPHVCLTEEDESSLASDPEEYARANACGEAAEDDAVQDALDGNVSGVTSRRAALDFLEALARVSFDANECEAPSVKPPRAKPTRPPPAKKAKKDEKDDAAEDEDEPSSGSAKPTLGELAARDVVDEMLAAAPKEKVEKVSKSAFFGAAGAAVEHAAPAAEAALGASAYFGVLRVAGALTAASRRAEGVCDADLLQETRVPRRRGGGVAARGCGRRSALRGCRRENNHRRRRARGVRRAGRGAGAGHARMRIERY